MSSQNQINQTHQKNQGSDNIPTLRFPEFSGEWDVSKFGKYCKFQQGVQVDVDLHKKEYEVGYVKFLRIENYTQNSDDYRYIKDVYKNDKYISEKDIVVVRYGATAGYIGRGFNGVLANNLFKIIPDEKVFNLDYLYLFLKSYKAFYFFQSEMSGGAMPALSFGIVKSLKIPYPSKEEQQKIASFLTAVDDKIEQLTKKLSLLEQYKKGVMQQLFCLNYDKHDLLEEHDVEKRNQEKKSEKSSKSQKSRFRQLRFKKEDGTNYPDWEEKKLGEVLDYEQPTKYLVSHTEYDNSYETPVLTAGKTFILGYTDETNNIFTDKLPVILFDDFTTASQYVDFPFKAKSSAMKILVAKENENIKFIYEAMQTIKFEVGGHGRHWISKYSTMNISFPCKEEQTKIANFLSAIDDKITLVNIQLENTVAFKKGLLQQMFV